MGSGRGSSCPPAVLGPGLVTRAEGGAERRPASRNDGAHFAPSVLRTPATPSWLILTPFSPESGRDRPQRRPLRAQRDHLLDRLLFGLVRDELAVGARWRSRCSTATPPTRRR